MDSQPTFMQTSKEESSQTVETSTATIAPIQRVTAEAADVETDTDWFTKLYATYQQIAEEIAQILSSYEQALIYGITLFLAAVFVRITFVAVETIHSVPLFALTFELIGLCFSVWFSVRYLIRVSTRAELREELARFRERFINSSN